ncbi:Zinc finger, RING-type [Sesbania bispinosa]|nr:Zinc finger, RING-type [Sesbania bispinosa]
MKTSRTKNIQHAEIFLRITDGFRSVSPKSSPPSSALSSAFSASPPSPAAIASATSVSPLAATNKGVKKKVLRSLPIEAHRDRGICSEFLRFPICLTEFFTGDKIRVLPWCDHGFHVSCIDAWLKSHSSCPSCRQILVVSRCDKCGRIPAIATASSSIAPPPDSEARFKVREDDANKSCPSFSLGIWFILT